MEFENSFAEPWYRARWAPFAVAFFASLWVVFIGVQSQRMPLWNLPAGPAADDVIIHSHYIASAAEAQIDGSWFPREAPRLQWANVQRYPFYQFYSFLPYHLAGLFVRLGMGAYPALVFVFFFTFVAGGLGAYGLCRAMGWTVETALICSAAYTFAPYHVTDLFGRFAFPEVFSFGLLPLVAWAALLCAQRPSLGRLLASSLAWAALVLTHNIFHVWTVPLLALWLIHLKWLGGQRQLHLLFTGLAYLLGLGMTLFFFTVPLMLGPHLMIISIFTETLQQGLTPAWVLFYPTWAQTYGTKGSPDLGLQVGWPFLASFLAMLLSARWRSLRNGSWILFAVMVFMAWSPFYFWPWLGPFQIISFPYRLLMYSTFFGMLLMGDWLEGLPILQLRQWLPWLLLLLMALSMPWKRNGGLQMTGKDMQAAWQADGPRIPGGAPYYAMSEGWAGTTYPKDNLLQSYDPQNKLRTNGPYKLAWLSHTPTAVQVKEFKSAAVSRVVVKAEEGCILVLPAFWYPNMYRVKINGKDASYGFVVQNLAVRLPAGESEVQYSFAGDAWSNRISVLAGLLWLFLAYRWFKRRGGQDLSDTVPSPEGELPPLQVDLKPRPRRPPSARG